MEVRAILRTLLEALVLQALTGISGHRGERQKPQDVAAQRRPHFPFPRTLRSGEAVWVMASFMSSLTLYRGQTQLSNSALV